MHGASMPFSLRIPPYAAAAALSATLAFAATDSRATCVGECSLELVHDDAPTRPFWPADRPLTVRGACAYTCNAPGGPGSGVTYGASDLRLREADGAPAGGFQSAGEKSYRHGGTLVAGKTYVVGWPGKNEVRFVAADAVLGRTLGAVTATPSIAFDGKVLLARGARVAVPVGGRAELGLADGVVAVEGDSEVALEGRGLRVLRGAVVVETGVVETGAGATIPVSIGALSTDAHGAARLAIDAAGTARLASWTGKLVTKTTTIDAGTGLLVEKGKAPGKPRVLPAAPVWPPKDLVLAYGGIASFAELFSPPKQRVRLVATHVVAGGGGVPIENVVDLTLPDDAALFGVTKMKYGEVTLRVRAIDEHGLEGPPSAPSAIKIAEAQLWSEPYKATTLFPPVPLCAMDEDPVEERKTAFVIVPARDHVLRCRRSKGSPIAELSIPAEKAGVVQLRAENDQLLGPKARRVILHVTDAAGHVVHGTKVSATVPGSAQVDPVVETFGAGWSNYRTIVRWSGAPAAVPVTFRVPGGASVTLDVRTKAD